MRWTRFVCLDCIRSRSSLGAALILALAPLGAAAISDVGFANASDRVTEVRAAPLADLFARRHAHEQSRRPATDDETSGQAQGPDAVGSPVAALNAGASEPAGGGTPVPEPSSLVLSPWVWRFRASSFSFRAAEPRVSQVGSPRGLTGGR